MHDTGGDPKQLVRQLAALRSELGEMSTQYELALEHLTAIQTERDALAQRCGELEGLRVQLEEEAQVLRRASVRSALLMEQVEVREQQYRTEAEAWASSSTHLAAEMRAAGLAQRFLIAEAPTDVPGLELATSYRPMSQTSGDWFGFLREEGSDQLGILIGDATGHGLAAALMTAAVFSSIETLKVLSAMAHEGRTSPDPVGATEARDLSNLLERIRSPRYLLALLDDVVGVAGGSLYPMTFLAGVYSADERTLRYANAGHCFPLLVSQRASSVSGERTTQVQALRTSSSPLGLGASTRPDSRTEHVVPLSAGDLVLFYSDGLTEACNARGRAVTPRRVAEWMTELREESIERIRDGLIERFDRYMHGATINDDVTFVLARAL